MATGISGNIMGYGGKKCTPPPPPPPVQITNSAELQKEHSGRMHANFKGMHTLIVKVHLCWKYLRKETDTNILVGELRMLVSEGRLTTSEYGRDSDLLGICTSRVCPLVLQVWDQSDSWGQ